MGLDRTDEAVLRCPRGGASGGSGECSSSNGCVHDFDDPVIEEDASCCNQT